jgi:hypothetical protein
MIPVRRFLLASAGSLLLLPFAAAAQSDGQPGETPPTAEAPAPKPEDETAKEDVAEEDKVVCKSVRADPSSRRKTRICRTMEEWRDLNIPT